MKNLQMPRSYISVSEEELRVIISNGFIIVWFIKP